MMINIGTLYPLTMRLSDVCCRIPKLIYLNHSTLPSLDEAATRCSNRLLGTAHRFNSNGRDIAAGTYELIPLAN